MGCGCERDEERCERHHDRHHHGHHGGHRSEHGHGARCQCGREPGEQGEGECCREEHGEQGECCRGGGHHGFHRAFKSKAEVIAELESYLAELKAEAQGVEEHLKELRDQ